MTTSPYDCTPEKKRMREACLMLPRCVTATALDYIETAIVTDFGGFTLVEGWGAWRNPRGETVLDAINVYTIACTSSGESIAKLLLLAGQAREALDQEEIYLRLPTGAVTFITADGPNPPVTDQLAC